MAIVKKSFGKNYLRCYMNEKGRIYSCEQIRKSWNNKVNYVKEACLAQYCESGVTAVM